MHESQPSVARAHVIGPCCKADQDKDAAPAAEEGAS